MMKARPLSASLPLILLLMHFSVSCVGQSSSPQKPLNLVPPSGPGRIIVPPPEYLPWQSISLFDQGTRPLFQTGDKSTGIVISYVLFPNKTHSATPEICRDDVLSAAMRGLSPVPGIADVKAIRKSSHPPVSGVPLAAGEFLLASLADMKVGQQNIFGVSSSPTECAEIHISKTPAANSDQPALNGRLDDFKFEPGYVPTFDDYVNLGAAFYKIAKSYDAAAIYYQRALDTFPPDGSINVKRYVTDQLSMSYGISGQVKLSRKINEAAIASDPDYPLYYYNLACADAEQHDASAARTHLEQAFARKQNTIPGETLPDPSRDDSIMKLNKDKDFWAFVQGLK